MNLQLHLFCLFVLFVVCLFVCLFLRWGFKPCVALAVLELTIQTSQPHTQRSAYLCLLSARIKGVPTTPGQCYLSCSLFTFYHPSDSEKSPDLSTVPVLPSSQLLSHEVLSVCSAPESVTHSSGKTPGVQHWYRKICNKHRLNDHLNEESDG